MDTLKRCFKCAQHKPLDAFYKHSAMSDGHLGKCKDCTKADVRKHRQENLERFRAYDRLRGGLPHRVAARKEYSKTDAYARSHRGSFQRWQSAHPERRKAQIAVNNAVRDGRLAKWPCQVCGDGESEAHHPAYSLPLAVVWLCNKHHRQAHEVTRPLKPRPFIASKQESQP